ncbi:MAG: hypothetical protein M3N47_14970, partial [Chloroflexota bacterium]|nr:hypothetical protein [Chloroflexota bacterium]
MPNTLRIRIPADVTLLLTRHARSEYSLACETAALAAEHCVSDAPTADALAHLCDCRVRVIAADDALKLMGGADATGAACTVSIDGPDRDLVGTLVGATLDRLSGDLEASEEEILAVADSIQRLRAVLDELGTRRDRPAARDQD